MEASERTAAVFFVGRVWAYSLLALVAFGVIGCIQLHRALKKIGCPRGKKALTAAACAASLLLAWFATPNAFLPLTAPGRYWLSPPTKKACSPGTPGGCIRRLRHEPRE